MSQDDFAQIMSFLRFDIKSERRDRIAHDKFCLVSYIWQSFIENCQKSYIPSQNLTVDEQLLPCKAQCKFIQYMANKPDMFGLKFGLIVDMSIQSICIMVFLMWGKMRRVPHQLLCQLM